MIEVICVAITSICITNIVVRMLYAIVECIFDDKNNPEG